VFTDRCVKGITADETKCAEYIDKSLALATALVPHIGYDRAAEIAKKAHAEGKTIKEVAMQEKILSDAILGELYQ
jgi:fumarate hydratase class II